MGRGWLAGWVFVGMLCGVSPAVASAAPSSDDGIVVRLNRAAAAPGTPTLVSAFGFRPRQRLDVFFDRRFEARTRADQRGRLYRLRIRIPAGAMIQEQMRDVVSSLEGVGEVVTDLTWTPPWSPEMMSDDAKFVLGF